jgi:hypothetical protein
LPRAKADVLLSEPLPQWPKGEKKCCIATSHRRRQRKSDREPFGLRGQLHRVPVRAAGGANYWEDAPLAQNAAGYRSSGPGTTKAVMTRANASANGEIGFLNPVAGATLVLAR